jgi:uncharacterized cupin superfamily protein
VALYPEASSTQESWNAIDKPDETRSFKNGKGTLGVATVGDYTVGRGVFEVGTPTCQAAHNGYVLEGRMLVRMDDGTEAEYGPGDAFYMPSLHDAWVVGDKLCRLATICARFGTYRMTSGEPLFQKASRRPIETMRRTAFLDGP